MFMKLSLLALAASSASAHFLLNYPQSRGDSYNTQFQFPCGGLTRSSNRTFWPTAGGAISITPMHAFAFTTINIALGNNVAETTDLNAFNKIMKATFNQTGGNGTFCVPKVNIPKAIKPFVKAGVNATIQVVQLVASGSALYNCADITFSDLEANRFGQPDVWNQFCFNSSGMSAHYLGDPDRAINYTELALHVNSAPSSTDSRLGLIAGIAISIISLINALGLW